MTKVRAWQALLGMLVVWLLAAPPARAQSVAGSQLSGVVRDASGAAVPGATVTVTKTDTGQARTAQSGADGSYTLPNLPVGPYELKVTLTGFNTHVQSGIVLQVGVNPTVDIALKVGAVSEQVQVEANATLVETQATGVGQVLENQRILELPLNGRNSADLVVMAGPVVLAQTSSSRSWQGVSAGEGFAVGGGTFFGTTYKLDGAMHNNPFDNFTGRAPMDLRASVGIAVDRLLASDECLPVCAHVSVAAQPVDLENHG
jgi:hypothetical protein